MNNGLTRGMPDGVANGMNSVVNQYTQHAPEPGASCLPSTTYDPVYYEGRLHPRAEIAKNVNYINTVGLQPFNNYGWARIA
tara:strand:- start:6508 stop:6750 length:243 start_codon:yes stop_codon:yes gene_type:complete